MTELAPCPCCGGPGQMKDTHGKIRQGWVGCKPCGLYIGWKISPDGAIRKWNRRAGLTPEKAMAAVETVFVLAPEEWRDLARALGMKAGGASPAPAEEVSG